MDSLSSLDAADDARAVKAVCRMVTTAELAAIWDRWAPGQRMTFVIGVLLALPACCPMHGQMSRQILAGFYADQLCPERDQIRRRALEILTAVTMVYQLPGAAPIEPTTHGMS